MNTKIYEFNYDEIVTSAGTVAARLVSYEIVFGDRGPQGETGPQGPPGPTAVTSVTGTAPISSSGGATPAISIAAATTSSAGSMSGADKTKLDGIAAGAEVNVNADWNASSGDAQILNKPTIPTASTATPTALGTAAAGTSTDFARGDHVHSAEPSDSAFRVVGSSDATKKVAFEVDTLVSPATTRTLTVPDSNGTIALTTLVGTPIELVIACSDETSNLTVGTDKVIFRSPYAFTLTGVRASVNTAPTGSTLIVDINEAGTTVLSTKLSIDASEKTSATAATPAAISDSAIANNAEITIDIDQIGSTIAGKGLKVVLTGTRA